MRNTNRSITRLFCASFFAFGTALANAESTFIPDGYKIETIETPTGLAFDIAGLDIRDNGDVFAATRLGDVWIYSDDEWSRFASGLHEPAGIYIEDDGSILVAQKPELTRLVDTNSDGVADEYIAVANGWEFHDNYHEYNYGPVRGPQGNYYGALNLSHRSPDALELGVMGSNGGYRGFVYEVSSEGDFSPYAWGFRSPAGIGTSPEGEIFITDNQGDWVATSKLDLVEKGKFYGHPVSLQDVSGYTVEQIKNTEPEEFDKIREKPVVWIPHIEVANSPGNPEWDTTNGKFGPFAGQIFIGDQTKSNVFRVLLDKVNGKYQGAVINFIDGFQSGNIRATFDKKGQLWLGQTARGWAAKGEQPFGLQKVVWDGTLPFELHSIKLTEKGFRLNFTKEVDPETISAAAFTVSQWHYRYGGQYGSPKLDEETVKVEEVVVSADGKQIDLVLPLTTDRVVKIDFSGIKGLSESKASTAIVYYTLNQLLSSASGN